MPEIDEATISHLGMVQNVVSRMAANSFALRALAVTLMAGVLAFTGASQNPSPVLVHALEIELVIASIRHLCLDTNHKRRLQLIWT